MKQFNYLTEDSEPNGYVQDMSMDAGGKRWIDYDTIVCPDGQIIDMRKLLREQGQAEAALMHIMPFFGGFIRNLRKIYTFKVETQATDGYNLFINPQFTYNLDMTGKAFVFAHEIMHCVLNHMRRGANHDHYKSNIAGDYEVNGWLVNVGLVKPEHISKINALYDPKYKGWGYEKIYDSIPNKDEGTMDNSGQSQQAQKNQQGQNGQNQGGQGSGGQDNQQYSAEYKAGWNKAMEDYKAGKLKL